mmetsp:Transcript_10962/g.16104  ORF Transcript_10962/g.16104 Transcript_10962/m.16104 type:complete len:395 (+) Transcript_10962:1074-2258(+)
MSEQEENMKCNIKDTMMYDLVVDFYLKSWVIYLIRKIQFFIIFTYICCCCRCCRCCCRCRCCSNFPSKLKIYELENNSPLVDQLLKSWKGSKTRGWLECIATLYVFPSIIITFILLYSYEKCEVKLPTLYSMSESKTNLTSVITQSFNKTKIYSSLNLNNAILIRSDTIEFEYQCNSYLDLKSLGVMTSQEAEKWMMITFLAIGIVVLLIIHWYNCCTIYAKGNIYENMIKKKTLIEDSENNIDREENMIRKLEKERDDFMNKDEKNSVKIEQMKEDYQQLAEDYQQMKEDYQQLAEKNSTTENLLSLTSKISNITSLNYKFLEKNEERLKTIFEAKKKKEVEEAKAAEEDEKKRQEEAEAAEEEETKAKKKRKKKKKQNQKKKKQNQEKGFKK